MSVTFQLSPIGGFAATAGKPGERAAVTVREMLTSLDGATFASRVEALHRSIFSRIPGLKNPWHENIPDFTGVRHHDTHRDIVEFKQLFLPLFKKDGGFSAAFNDAWGQAERYLIFARRERDYPARKGFAIANTYDRTYELTARPATLSVSDSP